MADPVIRLRRTPLAKLLAASGVAALAVGLVVLSVRGCTSDWEQRPVAEMLEKGGGGSIDEALGYLPQLMRIDRSHALKEVLYQLNGWAGRYNASGDGWPSPTVKELMQTWSPPVAEQMEGRLADIRFGENESEYLLQCRIMKDAADWVVAREYRDPLFKDWLEQRKAAMSADDWGKLDAALKLFDWSVRNVALMGEAADAERLIEEPSLPLTDIAPVYRQLPWQTLIVARGDVWQRARVFTQLLQQVELTGVVLALPQDGASDLLWAVGVPIGGELYLFEPRWGLPLPGPGGVGVATLREAKEDRMVLRRANLPGQFEYPVSSDQLSELVAKIDVAPFAIGHACYALQRSLSGENRMRVYAELTPVVQELKKHLGVGRIKLWDQPVLAYAYNDWVRERLDDKSPFSMQYLVYYGPFITDTLMNTARRAHLAGDFQATLDTPGALADYMKLRVDDASLNRLTYDREVQEGLQVRRGVNEPMEAFTARLEQVKAYYKAAKFQTSTFLGMAQIDLGNLEAARDWLEERTLMVEGTEAWHPQAEYLLGRIHELRGELARAEEFYKRIGRPQEAGNRIRARLLESRPETDGEG